MRNKNWDEAVKLRGRSFERNLEAYRMLTRIRPPKSVSSVSSVTSINSEIVSTGYRLAVMHAGAPCCGMNAAVRAFVRNVIYRGDVVLGIHEGIDGLIQGDIRPIGWSEVTGWVSQGGAFLGTRRTLTDKDIPKIVEKLKEFKIQGLLVIGGFEALQVVLQLVEARDKHPELQIPMCILPATISNNVPGTDFSLGADTALNEITEICDRIRQSAQGLLLFYCSYTFYSYTFL